MKGKVLLVTSSGLLAGSPHLDPVLEPSVRAVDEMVFSEYATSLPSPPDGTPFPVCALGPPCLLASLLPYPACSPSPSQPDAWPDQS